MSVKDINNMQPIKCMRLNEKGLENTEVMIGFGYQGHAFGIMGCDNYDVASYGCKLKSVPGNNRSNPKYQPCLFNEWQTLKPTEEVEEED